MPYLYRRFVLPHSTAGAQRPETQKYRKADKVFSNSEHQLPSRKLPQCGHQLFALTHRIEEIDLILI
jgi:hypothetical protein